ncbi:glutamate--cysteine ligase [Vibrio renipiscarius]|nr:glutamate--cysteine ligase [Vibrio renipiscarius]
MKKTEINRPKNHAVSSVSVDERAQNLLARMDVKTSLGGIRRGIERELVRTQLNGQLSELAHPRQLGSALTHPYITTDFAEAQLELVTPALTDRQATFDVLASLHQFVAENLPLGESMWSASMPPAVTSDESIVIAQFGRSNAGQLKERYREGLANRYGKRMQLISGIHYNFSLPETFWQTLHRELNSEQTLNDFISERYFHLIRNVLRFGWIIPYLFGASPALDASYLEERAHPLQAWDDNTYYLPWATSLRLSNLGYNSSEQAAYPTSFNSKQAYLSDLYRALTQPSERYTHLKGDQQLNGSVLQLENELYGSVRPKIIHDELRPLMAMCQYGVQYIELRSLDNNPYLPLGISLEQSQFLDLFLAYCALAPSEDIGDQERALIMQRQELVATQGRKPGLRLPTLQGDVALDALGSALLDDMFSVAKVFDDAFACQDYTTAIERERAKFVEPDLTPSARLLTDMKTNQQGYAQVIHQLSVANTATYRSHVMADDEHDNLVSLAAESLQAQAQLEAQQDVSFDAFIEAKNHVPCGCDASEKAA